MSPATRRYNERAASGRSISPYGISRPIPILINSLVRRLSAGETHNIDAKISTTPFVISSGTTVVTCGALAFKNGVLLGSEGGLPGTNHENLVLSMCTATQNGKPCASVKSGGGAGGTIETKPLHSALVEDAETKKTLLVEFVPENIEAELTNLEFTGANCVVKSAIVTGETVAAVKTDDGKGEQELGVFLGEETSWLLEVKDPGPREVCLVKVSGMNVKIRNSKN
jgi:hypothetical protein